MLASTACITASNQGAPHSTAASRTTTAAFLCACAGTSLAVQSPLPTSSVKAACTLAVNAALKAASNGAWGLRRLLIIYSCNHN